MRDLGRNTGVSRVSRRRTRAAILGVFIAALSAGCASGGERDDAGTTSGASGSSGSSGANGAAGTIGSGGSSSGTGQAGRAGGTGGARALDAGVSRDAQVAKDAAMNEMDARMDAARNDAAS